MSIFKLVTVDQRFIAETIARTGSEQLLNKVARSYVGLYNEKENWYIPLRANLGKKKPEGAFFETPFPTDNSHFKRPGLDFEKSIFVPAEYIIDIRNTLPPQQSALIFSKQEEIKEKFEKYVLNLEYVKKNSPSYKFSTVPLFPEGIQQIKNKYQDKEVGNKMKDSVPTQGSLFEELVDMSPGKQEEDTTNNQSEIVGNDNSRLAQAKRKLERLELEFNEKVDAVMAHQLQTNGQPMNDKRNGNAWFRRKEQLEAAAHNLSEQVQKQTERVKELEWQAEAKADGLNKQGGLIMSVDNIPRIKEEIARAEKGESIFSAATIRKYRKELKELEALKDRAEVAGSNLSDHAKALIASGKLAQWQKKPTIYFIKGLRKVALELNEQGEFQSAPRYPATTPDAVKIVSELLAGRAIAAKPTESIKEPVNESINEKRSVQDLIKSKDYKALSVHLKEGIADYLQTDTFKNYLNFVSQFHKYSARNVRLLIEQNPNVRRVASFKKWQEVNRKVKKGSKALYVYAPTSVILKDENGKPLKDENGKVMKQKRYYLVPVFDISQTEGEPLPRMVHELEGDFESPEQFVNVYKSIEAISPVPIKIDSITDGSQGYYDLVNKEIVVKEGLGELMTLRTLIHEVTHAKLHADSQCKFGDKTYSQQEFEAESVAYIVSNHLGIDTSEYSFGYLASWTKQGKTFDEFADSLDRITKEAQTLINEIDQSLEMSLVMDEPANKFEERIAIAQGKMVTPPKEKMAGLKASEPAPKIQSPRLSR